jgi:hypothetical protein
MSKRGEKKSEWVLVHVDDLPVPSPELLEVLQCTWVGADVLFLVAPGQWHRGKVYEITKRGEVKIAVKRGGAWVHNRMICFEYIPHVLRLANSGK